MKSNRDSKRLPTICFLLAAKHLGLQADMAAVGDPSLYRILAATDVHATTLSRRETSAHSRSSKRSSGGQPELGSDLVSKMHWKCLRHEAFDRLRIVSA